MKKRAVIAVAIAGALFGAAVQAVEPVKPAEGTSGKVQMFIAPPQRYVKWDSPAKLAATFLKGWLKSHQLNPLMRKKTAMGHGMVHVDCTDEKSEKHDFWTGITGSGDTETKLVMKRKVGIGIIFMNFDNGYIQSENEVRSTLSAYRGRIERTAEEGQRKRIKPLFMEFELTPAECSEAVAFYEAYKGRAFVEPVKLEERLKLEEQGVVNQTLGFGLTLDPYELYKKNGKEGYLGGGCTSYAGSFLKVTGHYDSNLDYFFKREIISSDKQMGGPGNRIGIAKLLLGHQGKSWVTDFSDDFKMSFFDPEKMYGFIDALRACSGDKTAISECRPRVKSWLKNYKTDLTHISVTESYEGDKLFKLVKFKKTYTNDIEGVRLKKISDLPVDVSSAPMTTEEAQVTMASTGSNDEHNDELDDEE